MAKGALRIWIRREGAHGKMSACDELFCAGGAVKLSVALSPSLSQRLSRHIWQSVASVSPSDLSVSAYVLSSFFFCFVSSSKHLLCKKLLTKVRVQKGFLSSWRYRAWLMSRSQEPDPEHITERQPGSKNRLALRTKYLCLQVVCL